MILQNTKSKRIILLVLEIVFVLALVFSVVKIIKWKVDNKKTENILKQISYNVKVNENGGTALEKYSIDFDGLKEINPDTVGWIKVNGTDIGFPVVKTKDNNFYLNHSFDRSSNSAGWIFVDYRNDLSGTDKNLVIYGHNRRDGSMFNSLRNILTEEWQNDEDNYEVIFITESNTEVYEVFSVYRIKNEEYYIKTDFDDDFLEFVDRMKGRSLKDFNVELDKDSQILTLSTCDNDSNYRVVLHAKKKI